MRKSTCDHYLAKTSNIYPVISFSYNKRKPCSQIQQVKGENPGDG